MLQMMQEITVEKRLALFLQAEHGVDLSRRFVRQQPLEELNVTRRDLHIHHEIGAAESEQDGQMGGVEQDSIEIKTAVAVAQDRDRKRDLSIAVDDLADGVGALVTKKQRSQYLNLVIRLEQDRPSKMFPDSAQQPAGVAIQVAKGIAQAEIAQNPRNRCAQAIPGGVVAAIGGRIGIYVLGCQRRAHEQEIVVVIAAVEDATADGIEKALGKFG